MRYALALAAALVAGCVWGTTDDETTTTAARLTGGDPERGRHAIRAEGCGSCHQIAGVRGAVGKVAPPLDGIARRATLAGKMTNGPDNLLKWIRTAQAVEPGNVMPNFDMSDEEARDIAAYLYTLR